MSDPATYQAYTFKAVSTDDSGTDRVVVGKVRWRIAPELPLASYLPTWDNIGYKTGLNVRDGQTVRSFSYRDVDGGQIVMDPAPNSDVVELQNTLGTQQGYQWVAFVSPPLAGRKRRAVTIVPDEDHTVEFELTLKLATKNLNRELMGAASRHMGDGFSKGSMNSLWVVPPAPYSAP